MRKLRFFLFAGLATTLLWNMSAEGAQQHASPAEEWNTLWGHLLWDIGVIGVIFGAITIYFLFTYTRKKENQGGEGKELSLAKSLAWAIIPAFIFMADDFWLAAGGFNLWLNQRTVPENALEVKVTGQMWSWDFEYENGAESDNEEGLVVPQGQPVVLRMQSDDTIHSFFIPDYRIKEDLMPGRVTYLWFNPKEKGEHVFTCTEFCGTDHSNMYGKVKVVSPEEFEKWSQEHQG